jgi:hypothetical protein
LKAVVGQALIQEKLTLLVETKEPLTIAGRGSLFSNDWGLRDSVTVFRGVHTFSAGELSGQLLRGMDEDREALRAHPDVSAHELKRHERNGIFCSPAVQTLLCFD